ncbi:MAG: ATP-binding protein [Nanoarchaeota archaeon]|nr:ATP-binding protein [Nanoarchaeota archaeon]
MVNIIAITGGKGGTGKSTVATALAYELSKSSKVLLVDADVDCPNDHLLLNIERKQLKNVFQRIPEFDMDKCSKCGKCGAVCRTKAIISLKDKEPIFLSEQCNGCGSCKIVCPDDAISWNEKEIGKIYIGKRDNLSLLSGELKSNQPVSEFIVNHLNEEIEKHDQEYDYIIVDTAAGTHCPVIAAFEKADQIIAVTEPTPLGAHDLEVILEVLNKIKKQGTIIVNRSDIGDINKIKEVSLKHSAKIVFEIPYSKDIVDAYSKGEPIFILNITSMVNK